MEDLDLNFLNFDPFGGMTFEEWLDDPFGGMTFEEWLEFNFPPLELDFEPLQIEWDSLDDLLLWLKA